MLPVAIFTINGIKCPSKYHKFTYCFWLNLSNLYKMMFGENNMSYSLKQKHLHRWLYSYHHNESNPTSTFTYNGFSWKKKKERKTKDPHKTDYLNKKSSQNKSPSHSIFSVVSSKWQRRKNFRWVLWSFIYLRNIPIED